MDSQPLKRAHPRVCGENSFGLLAVAGVVGSSPRVRGKLPPMLRRLLARGLIPACAGKTELWERANIRSGAHPRVCGENARQTRDFAAQWGSSPRVRGKLGLYVASWNGCGLIPACAGKTQPKSNSLSLARAHPRVCGENLESQSDKVHDAGSSPRVRGKHPVAGFVQPSVGLIPACAGKTPRRPPGAWAEPAHPRVCGENTERSGVLRIRSVRS